MTLIALVLGGFLPNADSAQGILAVVVIPLTFWTGIGVYLMLRFLRRPGGEAVWSTRCSGVGEVRLRGFEPPRP
jgi:hypothetical protein